MRQDELFGSSVRVLAATAHSGHQGLVADDAWPGSSDAGEIPRAPPVAEQKPCMPIRAQLHPDAHLPTEVLDALIEKTAREVEALEDERQQWEIEAAQSEKSIGPDDEEQGGKVVPLEVPAPPRIPRAPRESSVDKRWVRTQRESMEPLAACREYLDRVCRPQAPAPKPQWLEAGSKNLLGAEHSEECSITSLSVDPLAEHVKSLCQPW